jgi:hypothetical protein
MERGSTVLSQAARKHAAASLQTGAAAAPAAFRERKSAIFLVTQDESLWPQIGQELDREWSLKQVDTIDELEVVTLAGEEGIVVWDAREQMDRAGDLSRLQLHSARFTIIVIDAQRSGEAWSTALEQRQIISVLSVPFGAAQLLGALASARDECHARSALLGVGITAMPATPAAGRKLPWPMITIAAALCLGCAGTYLWYRKTTAPVDASKKAITVTPQAGVPGVLTIPLEANASADEDVDALLERARQAMLDRHYVVPAGENALQLYRSVLLEDPNNGEARQGLKRLAQILFARAETDLNDRKLDMALEALNTARSIDPDDARLPALDARIESMRSELGIPAGKTTSGPRWRR